MLTPLAKQLQLQFNFKEQTEVWTVEKAVTDSHWQQNGVVHRPEGTDIGQSVTIKSKIFIIQKH